MTDLERLDEAEERLRHYGYQVLADVVHHVRDLLVNGKRAEWCEVHDAPLLDSHGLCRKAPMTSPDDCRLMSKLLVDHPTEEE